MSAVDFPANPSASAVHRDGAKTWRYDGTTWKPTTVTQIGTGQVAAANLATTNSGTVGQVLTRGSGTALSWTSPASAERRTYEILTSGKASGDREETFVIPNAASATAFRMLIIDLDYGPSGQRLSDDSARVTFQLGNGTTWQDMMFAGSLNQFAQPRTGFVEMVKSGNQASWFRWGWFDNTDIPPSDFGTLSSYTHARLIVTGNSTAYLENGINILIEY